MGTQSLSNQYSGFGMMTSRSNCLRILLCAMLLRGSSAGFIDQDTPLNRRTTTSLIDGSVYHLVMSDEFNTPNRTFTDGHDPVWTALDKPDDDSSAAGGGSQHFYNSSFVSTTEDGMLKISTKIGKTEWKRFDRIKQKHKTEQAYYKTGMMQSWEKFCFTGGIVEVDVILPGDPFIGGLWPAIWMLGNLGRATYESSTNNIWPWSFDKCDRKLQPAQKISACNPMNHYGMHPFQGRGATEIDILEVMTGDSHGPLPGTDPPITLPYCDMTLQVAPGVVKNRPQSGSTPIYESQIKGESDFVANTWYEGLKMEGNTSINPFFYGTFLGETKPGEPVTRSKKQAFQADAVGAAHQLTPSHFNTTHTFRLEWQAGPGGRIDWFSMGHRLNDTFSMEGDGLGTDWVHVYSMLDEVVKKTMGSQIPIEPTYLIFNTAISSTWGFPYVVPDGCTKCYDCDDPSCACSLGPGFCKMLREKDVAMYIDSVRVYQSRDPSAHPGANHTIGCDPPEFPTRSWIKGHWGDYMRNAPFSYEDKEPMRDVQRGGGKCKTDDDCGASLSSTNLTAIYESEDVETDRELKKDSSAKGRGKCVGASAFKGKYTSKERYPLVCMCNRGFTGPQCLAQDHIDDTPSAYENMMNENLFEFMPQLLLSPPLIAALAVLFVMVMAYSCIVTGQRQRALAEYKLEAAGLRKPKGKTTPQDRLITGTSI